MRTAMEKASPLALILCMLASAAGGASMGDAMGMAMRKVQNDARVKEALGEPVEVVSTRSDLVFSAHPDGTSEVKLGFAVRGPRGGAVAHVTLGSRHGSDRYWVKEITVYCRDADRRIEIGGVGSEIPEWLAIVFGLGGAVVWVVAIVLGVKAARRKGVSPRWMWFGIHPLGAVIAWAIIAWGVNKRSRPPLSREPIAAPQAYKAVKDAEQAPRQVEPDRKKGTTHPDAAPEGERVPEPPGDAVCATNPVARIEVTCPKCNAHYKVDATHLGKTARCKKCDTRFAIAPSPTAKAPMSDSEIEELAKQVMGAEGASVSDLIRQKEISARLVQCGTSAAPIVRKVLCGTPMTTGAHFSNAARLCRVLGEIGGSVARETLELLLRADSKVGEFYTVKKAAREALETLSARGANRATTSAQSTTGHYYQGRVPQRGEGVTCFACGKTFDGHGPVFVDILLRERWFCPEEECMEKIRKTFAGKCAWCETPLSESAPAIIGTSMGDHFCSESCRELCGRATGNAQRRMGLW